MEHARLVDVEQGARHLLDVPGHLPLIVSPPLLQPLVELAPRRVLHDVVDFLVVVEEPVHLQDVGVVQVSVNFDFPPDLPDDLRVDNLFHGDHLDSHYLLGGLHPGQIDMPKFAPAQGPANLKFADVPVRRVEQQLPGGHLVHGCDVKGVLMLRVGIFHCHIVIVVLWLSLLPLGLDSKDRGLRFDLPEGLSHQVHHAFILNFILIKQVPNRAFIYIW